MRAVVTSALLLLAVLLACKAPPRKEESRAGATQPAVAERKAEPQPAAPVDDTPLDVPLKDLIAEYKDNSVRADGKWKGRLVRVAGKVREVKSTIAGEGYVALGSGRAFDHPTVQALYAPESAGRAADLTAGQEIAVVCRVEGLVLNIIVQLRECVIYT